MFRIELTYVDGQAAGVLTIGSFRETFGLELQSWTPATYFTDWQRALTELVDGATRVALMTWVVPPTPATMQRAWLFYREGESVFVQDRMFPPDSTDAVIDEQGRITDFGPRVTVSESGDAVSEWNTTVAEIEAFLR